MHDVLVLPSPFDLGLIMQLGVLLVVVVAGVCLCQDCSFPTNDDLEEVIVNIIRLGDSSSIPIVTIARFHPVCLAFGAQQDRYRLVSVVVEYTCSGHTNCPSGTAVEQIESECGSGIWSNTVLSSTDNTRSVPPDASFNTTTREDCSFCLTAELANNIIGVTTDNVTHCVGECITDKVYYYITNLLTSCVLLHINVYIDQCHKLNIVTLILGDYISHYNIGPGVCRPVCKRSYPPPRSTMIRM